MQENQQSKENPRPSANHLRSSALNARHRNWGGRRPGAGAPKGNLNALKHGRNSRRQAQLLETAIEIPQVRQALIDLANRERRRRKKAEEGYGVLMTRLLDKVAEIVLKAPLSRGDGEGPGTGEGQGVREDNQGHNNQEFLDFLNTTTAEMRELLRKPSRRRRITIKPLLGPPPGPDDETAPLAGGAA